MRLAIFTRSGEQFIQDIPTPDKPQDEISSAIMEMFGLTAVYLDDIDGRHIVLPTASIDYIEVLP